MFNAFRRSCVSDAPPARFLPAILVLCLSTVLPACSAHAQATDAKPETALGRQLDRLDLGVSGSDLITKGVSGTNLFSEQTSLSTSSTLGALIQIHYIRSSYVGFEFNYSYARMTENFNFPTTTNTGGPTGAFPVQTRMNEYTFGYVAHPHPIFGVQPFVAVGAGTTAFTPTAGGGEALPERARMTYYYGLGVEDQISEHFGVRVQLRQLYYKAPDFGENYLTIQKQTFTTEPTFGFYLRY